MFDTERALDMEYKEAMDKIRFSPDFEARTVAHILKSMEGAEGSGAGGARAAQGAKRAHRRRRRWFAGMGAVAAALLLAVALSGQLPVFWKDNAAPEVLVDERVAPVDAYTESVTEGGASESVPNSLPRATSAPAMPYVAPREAPDGMEYEAAYDDQAVGGMFPNAYMPAPAPMNTSEYSAIREQGFVDARSEPLSTFGADVDTASYANVRGLLAEGIVPPADAVRTEEFLNYFDYDYPAPQGDEPFSVTTELAPCPWNDKSKLLLIGLQTSEIDTKALPPANLVFLIDTSGSMNDEDKLPLAQKAFRMLTEELRPQDTVSIVTYAGSERVVLDGARGSDKQAIAAAIDSMMAYGSTNGEGGILTAYELAQKHFIDGGNNRVILATDGDLNVGVTSEGELTRLIEQKRATNVFLSVLGFGQDNLKDNKLLSLADHGNGNYHYIDSVLEARKALVEQMGANLNTVCKDVKLQVEFNPAKVAQYRLIGYEKRALEARDFADDAKDGGEIGAGHSVTALYELILAGDAAEESTALKYQTAQLTDSEEYLTVSIRAKEPDGDVSKLYRYPVDERHVTAELSANLRFAAAVTEVCMTLRDSEHKGSASYAEAAALLETIPDLTKDPYKDEFAYLVRTLARTLPTASPPA